MKVLEKWWFWFLCSVVLYANTFKHEYTIDDIIAVTKNTLVQQGVSAIPEIFKHSYLYGYDGREDESYRPLTLASFAVERSFFDSSPTASHMVQVLLYGLCVTVLFLFLKNLFGEERMKIVIAICALFMLHPIHTEVVANVKSRDELLAALFLFSALWYFSKYLINQVRFNYVMAVVLFFAATLSKETAVLGVFLFPATYYHMSSKRFKDIFVYNAIFSVPFLLYFGIRALVLSDVLISEPIDPVSNSLALASNAGDLFASNLAIFAKYIQLCFFPIQLSWDYSVSTMPIQSFGTVASILGLIFLLVILGITVFGILRRELIGFGGLVFISTFALTSNFFFLINCPLGERFMFIPVLGLIIVCVLLMEKLFDRIKPIAGILLLSGFCSFFMGKTVIRNNDWRDNLHIYEAGVEVCPKSVKTHFNLGTEYLEQGNKRTDPNQRIECYKSAIEQFNSAKRIYPEYVNIYENLGFVYAEWGKLITADNAQQREVYQKGLKEIDTALLVYGMDKPTLHQNKIFILEQLVKMDLSAQEKTELLQLIIRTVDSKKVKNSEDLQRQLYYFNILEDREGLIRIGKDLVSDFPKDCGILFEFSKNYFTGKNYTLSLELLELYLQANPQDLSAASNRGMLLEIMGKKNEALAVYENILSIDPKQEHTRVLYNNLKGIK